MRGHSTVLFRLLSQPGRSLRQLQQIHSQFLTSPHLSPTSTLPLLTRLLSSLSSLSSPSPLSYPLSLYTQMLSSPLHRPDHLTFPFVIKCCSKDLALTLGQSLHAHVLMLGLLHDTFIGNSLINLYCACTRVDLARNMFDEMPHRDIVSENSMLTGYLRNGVLDDALGLFRWMRVKNLRTWNSIVAGFVQGGRCREAVELFGEMMALGSSTVRPDERTVASVLAGCAGIGALELGKWVHGYLKGEERLEFDVVIGTALIDMYGKCGCVESAFEVFWTMGRKDVLAWTAMISALAVHGRGEEAFRLLEEMEKNGVRPNHVTFGAILSACAHSGMVERGRWCFDAMRRVYSVRPQLLHYACMVDLLSRAGLFKEAERLIRSMPMEPDCFVWGALLGACRMHGNVELGERVAEYLIALEPHNHAYYIILSDIYANAKKFDDVKRVRAFMKNHGIKKTLPGCSLIEIDGQVHEFSMKGIQELTEEIGELLNGINAELKWTGYVPDDDTELLQLLKF